MKRTILLTSAFVVALLITMSYSYVFTTVLQPPAGRTGSPADGGKTCADAGCHAGGPGGAQAATASDASIKFGTSVNPNNNPELTGTLKWSPSTIYYINVNVQGLASQGASRYGFEMSVLNSSNTQIGILAENQANVSLQLLGGVQFVGHQNASSNLAWLYQWTSPADTAQGPATFYFAFNGANNNNSPDANDMIRTKSVTVFPVGSGPSSIFEIAKNDIGLTLYPNPVQKEFTVHYAMSKSTEMQLDIINMNGQVVQQVTEGFKPEGAYLEMYNISEDLTAGIYFLRIQSGETAGYKKIIKN